MLRLLAHPRLGWIELSPPQVQDALPDGFDVIMMDRTYATLNKIQLHLVLAFT